MSDTKTTITLCGRNTIYTLEEEVTKTNLPKIISAAAIEHGNNAAMIQYLWDYDRGKQPILNREKTVRPEICNTIVENHAAEINSFFSGYFLGESSQYIQRGTKKDIAKEIDRLNEYMYRAGKASCDARLVYRFYACGIGYRMCLANPDKTSGVPFEIDVCDPTCTFIVYKTGFGKRRMLGCQIVEMPDETVRYVGYTKTHYFETDGESVSKWEPHTYGDIPIFEYNAYTTRTAAPEPVIGLLDAINMAQSNRLDGLEQFIQSLLVFEGVDLEEGVTSADISASGLIKIKTYDGDGGNKPHVYYITQQLDQSQNQTIIDNMRDTVKEIVGMPNNTKGLGGGASGNVGSVVAWQGWDLCESRIRETEDLFKESERLFLRHVLKIINDTDGINLEESDIEPQFARHNTENLLVKTQSLQSMLQCGIEPVEAIAASKIFSDSSAVATKSKPYLKKWEYREEPSGGNSDNGNPQNKTA